MKNLLIAILGSTAILEAPIWEFRGIEQLICVFCTVCVLILATANRIERRYRDE